MNHLQGVILDVDGTLVASNEAHARALAESLAEEGICVPPEKVLRLIGMGGDKLLPQVSGLKEDSPKGAKISQRRGEIFKQSYLPALRPTPGAPELLEHLASIGLKLLIASSAKKDELAPLLRICGAEHLVHEQTSGDDADNSKPDPDIVRTALRRGGLAPSEALMLGDTPYDIESSRRAGVGIIAFRCGGWRDADLAGALAVYDDPADLLIHFAQSPLAAAPAGGHNGPS